ncbi:lantibiotic dehydratase (plasmid) [Sutcliffiella horikoshii]|uniref:lantibiotic dehydratase n=1 Tax=Sutcliffiella horikoshii TaxID=79883 RepID=UPI001CC0F42B|nr:lantibiotic dehydratase [Sutcliffiella horikoshii]UAL49791.1 lantibiotic dehydratase [Sutcliffiella horikoshii]
MSKMKSKLKDYAMLRLAPVSFNSLKSVMDIQHRRTLELYFELNENIERIKSVICDDLYALISEVQNNSAVLLSLKRDIFNEKNLDKYELDVLEVELKNKIQKYLEYINKKHILLKDMERYFDEKNKTYNNIKEILTNPLIVNGMVSSSTNLTENLRKYILHPNPHDNKKLRKSEISFYKFISRAITKTSPFSTLTLVTLLEINNKKTSLIINKPKAVNNMNINYSVILFFIEKLKSTKLNRYFLLEVNPSFISNGQKAIYIKNTLEKLIEGVILQYRDSIITIKNNNTLDTIVKFIREKQITVNDLSDFLTSNGYPPEIANEFIIKLYKQNIINIYLPIAEQETDILGKLIAYFSKFSESEVVNIVNTFRSIKNKISLLNNLEIESFTKKSEIHNCVKNSLKKLFLQYEINFDYKNILYEDAALITDGSNLNINNGEIKSLQESLNIIHKISWAFDQRLLTRFSMREFYISKLGKNTEINVLDFFQMYLNDMTKFNALKVNASYLENLSNNPFNLPEIKKAEEIRNYFDNYINSIYDDSATEVELDFEKMFNLSLESEKLLNVEKDSRGFFLQIFKSKKPEQQLMGVLNGIVDGCGHYYSRFLNLEESSIEMLYQKVKNDLKKDNYTELVSVFGFNANLHPDLCKYEIEYGNVKGRKEDTNKLKIKDLFIKYDSIQKRLVLFDNVKNVEVKLLNFGFLVDNLKPLFYNFLLTFNQSSPLGLPIFSESEDFNKIKDLKYYPRVKLGELILKRRTWKINKNYIPRKRNGLSFFEYQMELMDFFEVNNLPQTFFIRIICEYKDVDDYLKRKDLKKPQYVDITNSISIKLFSKILENCELGLEITEMLPSEDDLIIFDGNENSYVSEILIEHDITFSQ